jgi:hypothetical protein
VVSNPLHACDHFVLHYDDARKVVLLTRTPTPFASLDDVAPCLRDIVTSLGRIARHECGIVIDTREGPVRNDPEFERVFAPQRKRVLAGFARAAVLVRTATGRLQAQRYTRADHQDEVRIFDDAKRALSFAETA